MSWKVQVFYSISYVWNSIKGLNITYLDMDKVDDHFVLTANVMCESRCHQRGTLKCDCNAKQKTEVVFLHIVHIQYILLPVAAECLRAAFSVCHLMLSR